MVAVSMLVVAAFVVAALARPGASAQEPEFAQAVKAAYLYKLAAFVDWPRDAFASPTSPYTICVVGDSSFAQLVARTVAGQRMGRRDFVVRYLAEIDRAEGCQILYAGGGPRSASQTLAAARGLPVLTVTDEANGTWQQGVIHFVIHRDRVRFEIDNRLARQHGLTISSRVLELAIRVMQ